VNVRSATGGTYRRAAVEIFVWSRAAIWLGALFAFLWFDAHGSPGLALWSRWDSGWFLRIAEHGYASAEGTAAFFPLYPGLVAVLGRALLGHYVLAGLAVSLASCAAAFVLLWRLAEVRLGRDGAWRTVLYLAVFPTALFLQAVYSESLYLALAVAAFALADRGRWPLAGAAAGLALLTRSAGIAVVAGLVVLAWPELRRVAWLALAPLAFVAFPLALQWQTQDPWAFTSAQAQWERHVSWAGPLAGLWGAVTVLGNKPEDFTRRHALVVNLECLAFLALFIVLTVLVWRWFGAAYGLFCAVSLALPLSAPGKDFPLLSLPRFGLVVFPFFLALSRLGERPRAHALIVGASALLLGIAVVQWATYEWVA
jgi:Mannosyltransferase (PIG-V)